MKISLRILTTLVSLMATINIALANGVIARLVDPTQIPSIVADYPQILGVEEAGLSPFVRFGVSPGNMEALELALEQDIRIVWWRKKRNLILLKTKVVMEARLPQSTIEPQLLL